MKRTKWIAFLCFAFLMAGLGANDALRGIFAPVFQERYDLNGSQLSLIVTISYVGNLLFLSIGGKLLDLFPRKNVAVAVTAVWAGAVALNLVSDSYIWILVSMFFALGASTLLNTTVNILTPAVFAGYAGLMVNVLFFIQGIGTSGSQLLLGRYAFHYAGWKWINAALLTVAFLVIVLFFFLKIPKQGEEKEREKEILKKEPDSKIFWIFIAMMGCYFIGEHGIMNFFSATMIPVMYYKKLLSGNPEDFAVYANSPFDREKRLILVAKDVSSRYTRRNKAEFGKVADYIMMLAQSHVGNYMVFFPSYRYMEVVEQILDERYDGSFRWQMQTKRMTEEEREEFLALFEEKREQSFVGLCVLGGIFSEGIDLKAERLEGTIIVGTGLPMVCSEQEILMQYFADQGENGYDYAYQYPGMNKVLQAAGRVIRTAQDRGVILLLDDRFLRPEIQDLFPREWTEYGLVTRETVGGWLKHFWESR